MVLSWLIYIVHLRLWSSSPCFLLCFPCNFQPIIAFISVSFRRSYGRLLIPARFIPVLSLWIWLIFAVCSWFDLNDFAPLSSTNGTWLGWSGWTGDKEKSSRIFSLPHRCCPSFQKPFALLSLPLTFGFAFQALFWFCPYEPTSIAVSSVRYPLICPDKLFFSFLFFSLSSSKWFLLRFMVSILSGWDPDLLCVVECDYDELRRYALRNLFSGLVGLFFFLISFFL
jgi:hypothetical protein